MFVSVHRMDGIIKCTRTCALLRTAHHPAGFRARAKNRMICRSPICKICTTHAWQGEAALQIYAYYSSFCYKFQALLSWLQTKASVVLFRPWRCTFMVQYISPLCVAKCSQS
jgi:hypothetical protein